MPVPSLSGAGARDAWAAVEGAAAAGTLPVAVPAPALFWLAWALTGDALTCLLASPSLLLLAPAMLAPPLPSLSFLLPPSTAASAAAAAAAMPLGPLLLPLALKRLAADLCIDEDLKDLRVYVGSFMKGACPCGDGKGRAKARHQHVHPCTHGNGSHFRHGPLVPV